MYGIETVKIIEAKDIPTVAEIEAFAMTTSVQNVFDFVCAWNKANIKKVQGNDVEAILNSFKQRALTAKAEADAGKIPSDIAFVGKFEVKEVVKP